MRAVVVYESMYGNTHTIANAIGEELRSVTDVIVVPVDGADAALAVEDAAGAHRVLAVARLG